MRALFALALLGPAICPAEGTEKSRKKEPTELDRIIAESQQESTPATRSPGSLFDTSGRLADLARDLRALQVNDLVTIVVSDKASAVSRGSSSSNRKTEGKANIASLGGLTRAAGPLGAMANFGGTQSLDGGAETTRESELKTTLTARVTHVLPNGNLVVEGFKSVGVNSERQVVRVRGVARSNDLTNTNRISSDRLAMLEVYVEGKGLVNDAIRRPNFLYRILLGILPF